MRTHHYALALTWTGHRGSGTTGPAAYDRDHVISAPGKPDLPGSSDPAFRGDPARWNPEELLLASLSQCHMLWYLGLAAAAKVVVLEYHDRPSGTMAEHLHARAHATCFIARSVNFPVHHRSTVRVA